MKNKDYECYEKVFEKLKEADGSYHPKRITSDFDQSIIKNLKFHFLTVTVTGCMFHFGQCIWRNIMTSGFKTKYGKDEVFI